MSRRVAVRRSGSAVSALSRECLVAVDARGAVVLAESGAADRVELTRDLDAILENAWCVNYTQAQPSAQPWPERG